ncbi:MAG: VWA domain-containing protein [Burkholderiales bacterium]
MLTGFFLHLKAHKLPVSTRELLTLLEALEARVISLSIDDFYALSRACLVKDEQNFDRFDLAFGTYFKGVDAIFDVRGQIPEEWLRKEFERYLSEEDKKLVEAMGGFDKLMETLKKRLEEQKGRHAGGNKWIGTGGTSPFGAYGYNPEGIRIGQEAGGQKSAVKVWDERSFRNLDGDVELNTRNIKVALRRLRKFAREGVPDELDLPGTIEGTARNAGWLDVHMQPERRNRVKVLLFLDVGGSMDPHVRVCEELFSAAKAEFRHLEYFYFHNCVYDHVWRDNGRRRNERVSTLDIIHKYGPDWKAIFVGDAAMSPYELTQAGGSVEYTNDEPGIVWLTRIFEHFRRVVWWNPEPGRAWEYTRSTQIVLGKLGPRMFPLTLSGIAQGIDALRH